MPVTKVLAVSGSLRASSTNTSVLLALTSPAPAGVEVRLEPPPDRLPFCPRRRGGRPPRARPGLAADVGLADAVVGGARVADETGAPLGGRKLDANAIATDAELSALLRAVLSTLQKAAGGADRDPGHGA